MDLRAFREYDIRGVVGVQISDDDVHRLGKAIGTRMMRLDRKRLVVGRDCRLSSDRYRDLLIGGLVSTGADIIDVGICPTPVFYFAILHLGCQGGVMITASHNPPEYNGFKVCDGFDAISGEEVQELRKIMEKGEFATGAGKVDVCNVIGPYGEFVLKDVRVGRKFRIGVDGGNAVGGPVALPILEKLGCEVYPLYCEMDGTYPNHQPDPAVMENLKDLRELVLDNRLDLGIAYDGDCDRLGVLNHRGEVVLGDKLMVIFARDILSRRPEATILSEVKCSRTLFEDIEKHGGKAIMWRSGHSLIKAKMRETDAVLGGEMTGHICFKDRYPGYDDAIYASCRLLEILAATGKTIPELLEGIPLTHATPEIRVECPDETKFEVAERAKRYFQEEGFRVVDIDGARIEFPDGWGLVRASNTQPAIVLRYEANTPERMEEIRALVENAVGRAFFNC